ncbi:MAG: YggT family protein [Gammaproteobacteria bacterium]
MHQVVLFLAETFFSLLVYAFLLRLLLQWARANFRNPIADAILRVTNWLILPLRRVLPPIGRVDTATVVAAYAISLVQTAALSVILVGVLPDALPWMLAAAIELLRSALWLYFWAIFIYALASMIAPGVRSPLQDLLESLCEPVLERIRSAVPAIAGLDLSPMWAGIIIQVLLILIR